MKLELPGGAVVEGNPTRVTLPTGASISWGRWADGQHWWWLTGPDGIPGPINQGTADQLAAAVQEWLADAS